MISQLHSLSRQRGKMEEDGGAVAQTNNSFARKLGSADKKTRDKGMALLVLWLSCQQVSENSPPFLHFQFREVPCLATTQCTCRYNGNTKLPSCPMLPAQVAACNSLLKFCSISSANSCSSRSRFSMWLA